MLVPPVSARLRPLLASAALLVSACRRHPVEALADAAAAVTLEPVVLELSDTAAAVEAGADTLVVAISTKALTVDGVLVAPLPATEDAARGFGGAPSAPDDPYKIAPLARVAETRLDVDRQIAKSLARAPASPSATFVCDRGVPYAILYEVLHTLWRSGFHQLRFVVEGARRVPRAPPPSGQAAVRDVPGQPVGLTAYLIDSRVIFGTADGSFGPRSGSSPGCERATKGITVGDWASVHECARLLHAAAPGDSRIEISAAPATTFQELVGLIEAVGFDGDSPLFPSVAFAPPH